MNSDLNTYFEQIEKKLLSFIDSHRSRIPQQDVEAALENVTEGEYGSAFEVVCAVLVKDRTPVSRSEKDLILSLADEMQYKDEDVRWLKKGIQESEAFE